MVMFQLIASKGFQKTQHEVFVDSRWWMKEDTKNKKIDGEINVE